MKNLKAKKLVNQPGKVLVGYWHNWKSGGGDGYKGGTSASVKLSETPKDYNVICVSFMKSGWNGGIPTFSPDGMTDAEFRAEVNKLNAEGRTVLIALGGADAHIELMHADENKFVAEIIRLVDVYGFDGLDIDLEQSAIIAGDNQAVIPSALKKVKDYFRAKGENFMITMAPEFPYLRNGGNYIPYISRLEGYYDYINPQYYNQAGDGISSEEDGQWITQDNDALKEKFLYSLTKAIVTGTGGYSKIPASKFVIGLPSSNDAAANGYVIDPKAVSNAMDRLKKEGLEIKGLMTWSINWDGGKNKDGVSYNWGFVKTYGPMLFGDSQPEVPDTIAPTVPTNLKATAITKNSISLAWNPSTDAVGVAGYIVFRNNVQVGTTTNTSFVDPDLTPNTSYKYYVKAFDNASNISEASATITVKTEDSIEIPAPTAPTNLHTVAVSAKSVSLAWSSTNVNCSYLIYRQSDFRSFQVLGRTTALTFTDSSVNPSSTYSYFVVCEDQLGNASAASNTVVVKTDAESGGGGTDVPEWISDKVYDKGDHVMYQGQEYEAQYWIQYIIPGTNPDAWKKIGGDNTIKEWNKDTIYNYPDLVTFEGSLYRAKNWTQGDIPGADQWGPWEKMS